MGASTERETGTTLDLKYDANGLITAVTVDADTNDVLMVAYMNKAAVEKTLQTGLATYWSRSRQKFWVKGEESGHTQKVVAVLADCDQDALVVKVRQAGVACHVGYKSCFYRQIVPAKNITADGGALELKIVATRQVDPAAVYKK